MMPEKIPPRPYAADTKVTVEKSEAELKAMLRKFGADQVGIIENFGDNRAVAIQFRYQERIVREVFVLPSLNDFWVSHTESGAIRPIPSRLKAQVQLTKATWRFIVDWTRMKLEAIENGRRTFHEVYLAEHVLADGRTMAETTAPYIDEIYSTGGVLELAVGKPVFMLPAPR